MEYYIALGIMLILSWFTTRSETVYSLGVVTSRTKSFKHAFLLLLPLTFLIAFRWNVGVDSFYGNSYTLAYHAAAEGNNFRDFEPGFYLLMRLFSLANIPFFWFLFAQAFFFMLCVTYGINKGSVAPVISILVFFFVQVYFDAYSALRQAMAEALAIVAFAKLGSEAQTKKRDVICLLLFALATTFHMVSILYFAVFLLCRVHFDKKTYISIAVVLTLAYPIIQIVLKYVMQLVMGNRYNLNAFASSYTILAGVILVVCAINYDVITLMNPNAYFYMNVALVGFLLMMNSNALMLPYRVFDAIKVGYIFIVPYAFRSCRRPIDKLVYPILIISLLGLWFYNSFYMQDNVMANYQSVFPVWSTATTLP